LRVVFVYGGYESLGIELLSAFLKKNNIETDLEFFPMLFDDGLIDSKILSGLFMHKNHRVKSLLKKEPDIIGFSATTDTYAWCCEIAKEIRKHSDIPIIFGGIHPTALQEVVLKEDFVDFICVGEGEDSFLTLCKRLDKEDADPDIPGIGYKTKDKKLVIRQPERLKRPLDELPFADKELFYKKSKCFKEYYSIMTSRGCPYNCFFCNNNVYRNIYRTSCLLRRRSVDNVIAELKQGLEKYNYKAVIFEDDAFVSDKKWSIEFLKKYSLMVDRPFMCLINPRNIDSDIAIALKKARCMNVEIGIQSMEKNIRKELLNRSEEIEEIEKGIRALSNAKVPFNIDHIGGIPGESTEKIEEAFCKYFNWRPNRITYFYLTYYPGTRISQIAIEKGLISKQEQLDLERGHSLSFEHGGNLSEERRAFHDRIRTLGSWGVFFPKLAEKILLSKKAKKLIPQNHFLGRVIPAVLNILTGKEIRGQFILKKYFYHFIRGGF